MFGGGRKFTLHALAIMKLLTHHSSFGVYGCITLQDLLKDFLEKKDNGELMIQKTSNLLKTILKEVAQK